MTSRVGTKGQVVIPKSIRDRTGLKPGVEVEFALRNGEVILAPMTAGSGLVGRFAGSGMAARLLDDRASEPR